MNHRHVQTPPRDGPSVRPADLNDPADAGAVVDLLDAYARDPMGAAAPLSGDTRERLVPALREVPGALVLLAFLGQRPAGVAVCFAGFSTFRARPLLNVHDLAVLPGNRGQGIGGALLAAVEEAARQRACCKVTLEVREDNVPARALYARRGFGAGTSGGAAAQYLFLEKRLD